MGKFIVLALLAVAAFWLVRRALRRSGLKADVPRKAAVEADLARCAHCGLHLPRAEARAAGEQLYCSEEHARLGRR
jgi:uncharacterized protein